MNWFKRKERCYELNCDNSAFENGQCKLHSEILELRKINQGLKFFEKVPCCSDVDHILWLMDKFPIEDFEIKSHIGLSTLEHYEWLYFKGVCIHQPNSINAGIFGASINVLEDTIKNKLNEKKEVQRKQVLDEMADERIAINKGEKDADKLFGSILTEKAKELINGDYFISSNFTPMPHAHIDENGNQFLKNNDGQWVLIPEQYKKSKSVKKAYKRKAKKKK